MTKAEEALLALDEHLAAGLPVPETNDGKVNVVGLCRVLKLNPASAYAQHFYRNERLRTRTDKAAQAQGLQCIGARLEGADQAVVDKAAAANRRAADISRVAVEERAASQDLADELVRVRNELARTQLERDGAAERLRIIEQGGVPPPV